MRIQCPSCKSILEVADSFTGDRVRCGGCKAGLRIVRPKEEDVLDWIGKTNPGDTSLTDSAILDNDIKDSPDIVDPDIIRALGGHVNATDAVRSVRRQIWSLDTGIDDLTLLKIGKYGPLFEFPQALLASDEFRAAMPRKCIRCGTEENLGLHRVYFTSKILDAASAECDIHDNPPALSPEQIATMSNLEIVRALKPIEQLPDPANKPMIFWSCNQCSPYHLVFTQGGIKLPDGSSLCQLQIARIWRVREFLATLCETSPALDAIDHLIENQPEVLWDRLPGKFQQRMSTWYHPEKGEQYIDFVPEQSHKEPEQGHAGILITSRRLIVHGCGQQRELYKGTSMDINFAVTGDDVQVEIFTPNWEMNHLLFTREDMMKLRKTLVENNFPVTWL